MTGREWIQQDTGENDDPTSDDSPWEVSSDSEDGHIAVQRALVLEPSSNPVASDDESQHSASLASVKFVIDCLWKLPIRRPAPLDRMTESFTADASNYQPFDIMFVRDKFPTANETVAMRLGKMISRRRQLIRYRKNHTYSLQEKLRETGIMGDRRAVLESDLTHKDLPVILAPSIAAPSQKTHETTATTLKLPAQTTDAAKLSGLYAPSLPESKSSMASEYTAEDVSIKIPNRPKGENGEFLDQFICPYCSIAQVITSERRWK